MSALEIDIGEAEGTLPGRPAAGSRRRVLVLGTAAATFLCIFMLRELTVGAGDDLDDAFGLLYVLPVALVSLELGLRAGATAAFGISAAIATSTIAQGLDLDPAALVVRSLIFLMAAMLAGMFSDRMRTYSELEEMRQVALREEVESTRRRLSDHLRTAGDLIEHQERERRQIAVQLHEEAAQTLAAALLTVGVLERGPEGAVAAQQLEQVRDHVRACIVELRSIADSLRPAVLDELGLGAALQRISEVEAERGGRTVTFLAGSLPESLPRQVETSAYRLIEELLQALAGAFSVDVALIASEGSLRVSLQAGFGREGGPCNEDCAQDLERKLTAARVRVELLGGSLALEEVSGERAQVLAQLPLPGLK